MSEEITPVKEGPKARLFKEVKAILEKHEVSEAASAEILALVEPKAGGSKSDVNDYTVYDADGKVVAIYCAYHKKWEPVTDETGELLFNESKSNPNGFYRDCKVGVKQYRDATKEYKEAKDAIIADLMDSKITGDEATEKLRVLEENKDFNLPHSAGIGSDTRPEA